VGQFSVAMRVTVWIYRDCFPDSFLLGIRKVVNGHSFILIRQMAELVRRALAEVCIVPVLLVLYVSGLNVKNRQLRCNCRLIPDATIQRTNYYFVLLQLAR